MKQPIILKLTLKRQFEAAMTRGRAVLFSAPCGFGKTTTAHALVSGQKVYTLTAGQPDFILPSLEEEWDILLVDDLQIMEEGAEQEELCRMIREYSDRKFVFLTRGAPPHWLLPFQLAGVMTVLGPWELAFDQEATRQLLEQYGVAVTNLELASIQKVTRGCPMPLIFLIQHLLRGEPYNETTNDLIRRDLFLYFEEVVFRRLEPSIQRFLLELAPFDPITPELARIVSGDGKAGELLGKFQRESSAFIQERLDYYHFWPIFRRFLLWELEQTCDDTQQKMLYNRGGLYYELNEDYGKALECYTRSGDHNKISELLVKNAERHPGMGHYKEMEPYYQALPEHELRSSPALMQGMSMLRAMELDFEGSEKWYQALQDFAKNCRRTDMAYREARSRLIWLDLALPQRKVEGMISVFPKVFRLLTERKIHLPPFSVTSTLPSLMNGGKDFSPWSRKDDLLYTTLRLPVETVLGRDGVCMADCAIAESKFEKGENIRDRALSLMLNLDRVRRYGTADMEFAVVGLLARTQIDAGRPNDARQTLETLRERFFSVKEKRFLPNLDAMLCRVNLYQGKDEEADQWYREKAPKNPQKLYSLKRYQYLTQAMVELALGDEAGTLLTLAPLKPYFSACARYIDSIHLHVLSAIARFRLMEGDWRADMVAALDIAIKFHFIRPVSQYGGAVLPLLEDCGWKGDMTYLNKLTDAVRIQTAFYPDFLQPRREMVAPLSPTEIQVLRLICADKSNAEIGQILGIKVTTVKVHVSHILEKLNVKRRSEAKSTAQQLRLI